MGCNGENVEGTQENKLRKMEGQKGLGRPPGASSGQQPRRLQDLAGFFKQRVRSTEEQGTVGSLGFQISASIDGALAWCWQSDHVSRLQS